MPGKLVTMVVPSDYTPSSTDPNIAEALDDDAIRDAEIEVFAAVRAPVGAAEYRIGILAADLERHLLSLRQNIQVRTAEQQAELTLSDLEGVIGELLVARENVLGVLGRSDAEPQQEAP